MSMRMLGELAGLSRLDQVRGGLDQVRGGLDQLRGGLGQVRGGLDQVRAPIRSGVAALLGSDRFPEEQYDSPAGDPGLFGPESVTWRVHADVSMFVGGIAALMLQTLHPMAAAGVSDHSRFREEPLRRLSRTGSFVAATTYGATPVAESVIAAVRRVHERVNGVTEDGSPYRADDPDLLRWVHVAEVTSFISAHRRYCPFPVRGTAIDRYYAETAVVARRLGATDVPGSRADMLRYLAAMRPDLAASARARELLRFISRPVDRDPVTRSAHALLIQAAIGLLPGWARDLHDLRVPPHDEIIVSGVTYAVLQSLRLGLGPSPVLERARRRAVRARNAGTGSASR
jgi:uncharacterized protein (DUF2236 family)